MPSYSYPATGSIRSRLKRRFWESDQTLGRRVFLSIADGLLVSGLLASIATISVLVNGNSILSRIGLTYPRLLGWYAVSGVLGGTIFGIFKPLVHRSAGRLVVWTLALLPSQLLLTWSLASRTEWRAAILIALLAASAYGAIITFPPSPIGNGDDTAT